MHISHRNTTRKYAVLEHHVLGEGTPKYFPSFLQIWLTSEHVAKFLFVCLCEDAGNLYNATVVKTSVARSGYCAKVHQILNERRARLSDQKPLPYIHGVPGSPQACREELKSDELKRTSLSFLHSFFFTFQKKVIKVSGALCFMGSDPKVWTLIFKKVVTYKTCSKV